MACGSANMPFAVVVEVVSPVASFSALLSLVVEILTLKSISPLG